MSDNHLKTKFAVALLKHGEAFKAGLDVFGADTQAALHAATHWIHDQFVLSEKERVLNDEEGGEMALLPSKAELARKVWDMATNEEKKVDFRDRLEALKFYGTLRNFVERPKEAGSGDTTNVVAQNVMIVRDHGSSDQWEAKLREQQRTLIANAAKPH